MSDIQIWIDDSRARAIRAADHVVDRGDGVCYECLVGRLVDHPCPIVRTIQHSIKEL